MGDCKKCDRCGEHYAKVIGNRKLGKLYDTGGATKDQWDLCPDCWELFGSWIANDDSTLEKVVSGSEPCVTPESCRQYADQRKQGDDADCESCDSREKLEAEINEWAAVMNLEGYQLDMIHGWLNRRAAILERKMVKFNRRYFDCVEQEKKIAELTRKMEILKAHGVEIVDAVAGGYEVYNDKIREVSELQAQVDKLTAERDKLQEQLRIGWECECRLQAERDKLKEANDYHAAQYELASEDCDRLQAQVDELKAERVKLRSQICKLEDDLVRTSDERDNWKANCEDWKKDCERYRSKFGKCLDYADAIHALMDEGLA